MHPSGPRQQSQKQHIARKSPSPNLRLRHPIRLLQPRHLLILVIPPVLLLPLHQPPSPPQPPPLIPRKNLHPANMRILTILMILHDLHLHHHAPQPPPRSPHPAQIHLHPPPRLFPDPDRELGQIVRAVARQEHHARRRVTLVELEVEVQPEAHDGDELEEVHGQQVRLGAVGLPEGLRGGREERGDAAAGLVRRDGPGGERGDFAVQGGRGRGGGGCFWGL